MTPPRRHPGRLRALAVTGSKRAPQWPSIPTIAESGVPGYEVTSWYGACAPAATPRRLLDKLNEDFKDVLLAPEMLTVHDGAGDRCGAQLGRGVRGLHQGGNVALGESREGRGDPAAMSGTR
jgi:hypothetical protein